MAIDVCIRGSGVVGKALALLLARARIRVGLVQTLPRSSLSGDAPRDVRAFALNAASQALLSSLRAWPEGACAVQHMQVHGDGAGASEGLVQFDASALGAQALAWIVDASALEERLHTAVSFAPEITLLNAPEPATLTVICEGRTSASREAAGLHYAQAAYDQTAIAALVQTEQPHLATARQWMRGGEVCALLPRNSWRHIHADGGNSVALVWSVQHEHAQQLLALQDAQFCAALQAACGNALGAMRLDSPRVAWPLYLAQTNHWVGRGLGEGQGAWALAGDAAHAMHPLAGQGLNLGLGDAAELARVLAGKEYFRSYGDLRLLRRYERARKGDAAALRVATDGLQRLFALDDDRARSLRNWGMRGFEALAPVKSAVMRRAMGQV